MKFSAVLAAAAALTLSAVAHASSSHGPGPAHSRRFNRVLRSPDADEAPIIDLELNDGQFSISNASLVAQGDTRGDDGEGHMLAKRGYSGRATFFQPGLGACGTYSSSSDYMVAMNEAQYGDLGAVSSWCFKTITISYGGKTANAQVLDACPGCPYGGLDMSPSLFKHFADPSVGVFYMNWAPAGSAPDTSAEDKKSKEAAAAASSSSQAAAKASSASAAAAWASSSSSRAAAWASSSSAANAAWLSSSSSSAAAAAASSASSAAAAAAASRVSAASVASVASVAAAASASDEALSIAAVSAASAASVASAAAVSASLLPTATLSSAADMAVATATGVAKVAAPAIPAGAVGGNLDGIAQLVIAMGNVVAAQAAVAQSA